MITYRPAIADDRAFIVSGWSSSLRETRDLPFISMADYSGIMHPQIGKVLDRSSAQTIVAEGSVLAGFICFELGARIIDDLGLVVGPYVFYVYVAQPQRRFGVARGLFAAAGIDPTRRFHYAARTRTSWELQIGGRTPFAKYSPFHARYTPEENEQHVRDHARQATRRKGHRARAEEGHRRREVLRRPPR